jgi:hypothetical protein
MEFFRDCGKIEKDADISETLLLFLNFFENSLSGDLIFRALILYF